jgi:hypothetical protein
VLSVLQRLAIHRRERVLQIMGLPTGLLSQFGSGARLAMDASRPREHGQNYDRKRWPASAAIKPGYSRAVLIIALSFTVSLLFGRPLRPARSIIGM